MQAFEQETASIHELLSSRESRSKRSDGNPCGFFLMCMLQLSTVLISQTRRFRPYCLTLCETERTMEERESVIFTYSCPSEQNPVPTSTTSTSISPFEYDDWSHEDIVYCWRRWFKININCCLALQRFVLLHTHTSRLQIDKPSKLYFYI